MSAAHKEAIARAHRGNKQSASTKKKISSSMAGKSNFEGKHHSKASKDRIRHKRGHDDRVRGRRWVVNASGKTARKRVAPAGYLLGHRRYKRSRNAHNDQ